MVSVSARKLRPAKLRNAARRRWFEHELERVELRPAPGVQELGTPYGGWRVPTGLIEPGWVCYSAGAGGDVSFDLELIQRFGVVVRAFDPVAGYVADAIEQAGEELRFSAYQAGIAPSDGPIWMQVTHDPISRSVSAAGLYESGRYVELPGRSLDSLMAELGDKRIELLKLDLEGGEYEVLPTLDLRAIGVVVLAIQLHHTGSVPGARRLIESLGAQGYVPVACRPAVKLTFAEEGALSAHEG